MQSQQVLPRQSLKQGTSNVLFPVVSIIESIFFFIIITNIKRMMITIIIIKVEIS